MRINGYKCNYCGNIHNDVHLKQGWFEVEERVKDKQEYLHFCSIGCLSAWALKQKMDENKA